MKRIAALIIATIIAAIAFAAPAQAGSDERFLVQYATEEALRQNDWETRDFACNWFQYDRRDMYQESWYEVWIGEGVTYRDMRIGIYRAMKNVCD